MRVRARYTRKKKSGQNLYFCASKASKLSSTFPRRGLPPAADAPAAYSTSAFVRIRPHTSTYMRIREATHQRCGFSLRRGVGKHISQLTAFSYRCAIRPVRQHTSGYVRIRRQADVCWQLTAFSYRCAIRPAYVSIHSTVSIRQHTSRQHTSPG
jgi:hypothetical protein